MNNHVNPEMLILAREMRGLTQSGLAQATQINQGLISRYESDMREITSKDLSKIAEVLKVPESFFYRSGQMFGLGSNGLYHRKRQSVPAGQLRLLHAKINRLRLDFEKLLEGVEFENEIVFPQLDVAEVGSVARIADLVRAAWKLPMGPIKNLVGAIENAGGLVHVMNFGTVKVDAIVQWIPPMPPIFLLNEVIPGDRLRYTLAHEIGHLIMHAVPHENIEAEADEFAAAFLMPANEIISDLNPCTVAHFAQLKPYWKVSIRALVRRAYDLKKIPEWQYRNLNAQLNKLGYKTREPNPIPIERPTLVKEVIQVYLNEHRYTITELADLLDMYQDEFESLYLAINNEIRIVGGRSPNKKEDDFANKISGA